jgi:double-stranded uracil-DNA glycosylase
VTLPPEALKRSFPPVVDERTRVLLLGSLPGEASLARGQYYAHPRNQFWRLIGAVTGVDLVPLTYPDRLEALLAAHVGLWDVVASARREGSLDAAIRDHSPNALPDLIATLPALRAVGFNGGTSARLGMAALAASNLTLLRLPSSSPAHTLPFEHKRDAWTALRPFLDSASDAP